MLPVELGIGLRAMAVDEMRERREQLLDRRGSGRRTHLDGFSAKYVVDAFLGRFLPHLCRNREIAQIVAALQALERRGVLQLLDEKAWLFGARDACDAADDASH